MPGKKVVEKYFLQSSYKHFFIIINQFPGLKNAEAELIMRIELYCKEYNIDFITINSNGKIQGEHVLKGASIHDVPVNNKVTVLALHYHSRKISKHQTYLVSWNPIQFLERESRTLKSFDGYLSAYSDTIDSYMQVQGKKK